MTAALRCRAARRARTLAMPRALALAPFTRQRARPQLDRAALGLGALALCLGAATAASADTLAITGATVYVSPEQKLEGATVVVVDGKLAAIGADARVPANAKVVDGRGKVVTAGLIDCTSQLGLIEIDGEAAGTDGRFGVAPSPIHAAFRTIDAFDPRSVAIPVARQGGLTSVITGPSGGLVAGQSAWMSLADAASPPPPLAAPAGMNAALGAGAAALGSRGQAVELLRELLDDAADYDRRRRDYDRNLSRKLAAERGDLEALVPVLRGRLPLVVTANAEVDVRAALALAKERRLRLVIAGGAEAWRLADELAKAGVGVILDPTANLPGELSATDVRDDSAAVLAKAGVAVAVSTLGRAAEARTLRQLAGVAVGNGLPWDKALAAVTTVPAALFGQPQRGRLTAGAAADLVLWSGDPLELATQAELVVIAGVPQSRQSHQTRLLDRYRHLPPR